MFCKHCGFNLPDNSNFCPKCGKVNTIKEEPTEENYDILPEIEQFSEFSIVKEEMKERGGRILKNAIMGLGFSLSFYLSPLGLIFAIISRILCGRYKKRYGETNGNASVGNGIGIAALVVSIVFTSLLLIYILSFIATFVGVNEIFEADISNPFGI